MASVAAALALASSQARAADQAKGPVKLSDEQLEQVAAGEGSLLDLNLYLNLLLKDIAVTVNVSNVPVNAGAVVQANVLGTAAQTASVTALQEVTQLQQFPTFTGGQ
jgi:hypothetical protein